MADRPDFSKMSVGDLRTLADNLQIDNTAKMKKGELIAAIEMMAASSTPKPVAETVAEPRVQDEAAPAADAGERRGRRPRKTGADNVEGEADAIKTAVAESTEVSTSLEKPQVQPQPFQRHRESNEGGENRNNRPQNDAKNGRGPREPRENRENREPRENREGRETRETREPRNGREPRTT